MNRNDLRLRTPDKHSSIFKKILKYAAMNLSLLNVYTMSPFLHGVKMKKSLGSFTTIFKPKFERRQAGSLRDSHCDLWLYRWTPSNAPRMHQIRSEGFVLFNWLEMFSKKYPPIRSILSFRSSSTMGNSLSEKEESLVLVSSRRI